MGRPACWGFSLVFGEAGPCSYLQNEWRDWEAKHCVWQGVWRILWDVLRSLKYWTKELWSIGQDPAHCESDAIPNPVESVTISCWYWKWNKNCFNLQPTPVPAHQDPAHCQSDAIRNSVESVTISIWYWKWNKKGYNLQLTPVPAH